MKYIDWVEKLLTVFGEESGRDQNVRERGLYETTLEKLVWGENHEAIKASAKAEGLSDVVDDAVFDLKKLGLIKELTMPFFKLNRNGLIAADNLFSLWEFVCSIELQPDYKQTLSIVNSLSQVREDEENDNFAWTRDVSMNKILGEWSRIQDNITEDEVAEMLRSLKARSLVFFEDGYYIEEVKATYAGLAWEQRRDKIQGVKELKKLVAEWETTSVDFKRELYLDTPGEKAEFVKDVLGLANTQASGRRWLIVGFDDSTRDVYIPAAPPVPPAKNDWHKKLTQDRIEQILSNYIKPSLDVRYNLIDYKNGKVGVLEILRDPKKLPYTVSQDLGNPNAPGSKKERRRIEAGQTFVRHGSHSVEPDADELQDLHDEADRAKLNAI
jgi:Putative DNA-binding domain